MNSYNDGSYIINVLWPLLDSLQQSLRVAIRDFNIKNGERALRVGRVQGNQRASFRKPDVPDVGVQWVHRE